MHQVAFFLLFTEYYKKKDLYTKKSNVNKLTMKKKICMILLSFTVAGLSMYAQENKTEDNSVQLKRTVRKKSENQNLKTDEMITYRDFRFTIGGGYARRLGEIMQSGNTDIDKLTEGLKNGYNIDVEAQYFFKEHWGLGLNFYYNRQSSSSNDILIGDIMIRDAKENIGFTYIGPTFNMRYNLGSAFTLYMNLGLGALFYRDEAILDGGGYSYNKTVLGSYASISGDYKFNQNIGAGLKLSVGGGSISGEEFGMDKKDRMSLSNFMVTAYISFRTSK